MENKRQQQVFVVDDSAPVRQSIRKQLEGGGYAVQSFCDGLELISCLCWMEDPPDLVIMDIDMPRLDGFSACRKLRQYEEEGRVAWSGNPLPVVLISANDTLDNRRRGFRLGCVDFIAKPFGPGEILQVVDSLLRPETTFAGMTALVVDDSQVVRYLVARCLARIGLQTREAEDGQAAYEMLCEQGLEVDLVIVDYRMPRMKGDEFVYLVRRCPETAQLPVLFLSSEGDSDHIITMFRAGASDYLVKPFISEELQARVKVHLQSRLYLSRLEEMNRNLYDLAVRDSLTGLHNRRYLMDFLNRIFSRIVRSGMDLGCVFFDLDHFKRINDSLGHDFGDYVLAEIGGLVRRLVREGDLAVRYGGEEFVLILPRAGLEACVGVAERLRTTIETHRFSSADRSCRVTISAGVATVLNDNPASAAELIQLADRLLYVAKSRGRNQVAPRLAAEERV